MSAEETSRSVSRQLAAEAIGSFFLFVAVIGAGIMAENWACGNEAVALLAHTVATGAILFVLIAMLGTISCAHSNHALNHQSTLVHIAHKFRQSSDNNGTKSKRHLYRHCACG